MAGAMGRGRGMPLSSPLRGDTSRRAAPEGADGVESAMATRRFRGGLTWIALRACRLVGLVYVNYGTQQRTPKLSAHFYRQTLAANAVR